MEKMERDVQSTEKTFSQADVDRIVAERLARERAKQPELDAREKDIQKRENVLTAREKLIEKNLPESFASLVAGAEDIDAAIETIINAMTGNEKKAWGLRHEGGKAVDATAQMRAAFGLG